MGYLDKENIITEFQSGFLIGKSAMSALDILTDDIYTALNNSNILASVYIDFKKAFNTINHKILIQKLNKNFCKSMENYLTNRQ